MTEDTKYEKYVELFCQHFEDGINQAGLNDMSRCGFIFLFVRDDKPVCIDRASNLTDGTIKNVLSEVLREMKKDD